MVDGTLIKVGTQCIYGYELPSTEHQNMEILALTISKERNMFVAERFLQDLIKVDAKIPVSTYGRSRDSMAWGLLKLDHHLDSSFKKSLIETMLQFIKERTESFDGYVPQR